MVKYTKHITDLKTAKLNAMNIKSGSYFCQDKEKRSELIWVFSEGGGHLDIAKVFQNKDGTMNPVSEPGRLHT